jgi:hypothetical protein
MRGALVGHSHFGPLIDVIVLCGIAIVLLCIGAWRFSKIEI